MKSTAKGVRALSVVNPPLTPTSSLAQESLVDNPSMPSSNLLSSFNDAIGYVLIPLGKLAWFCVILSYKNTCSCFDRLWPSFTSHFFRLGVYLSHFISLTSCLKPRLKYPTAYLTFPLGSKSTWHLKFNMSNTKLKLFFQYPICSSSSLSHLSK